MQDIEFTIEKGKLYMLQCRVGKRNGVAAVRMATEMYKEKLIDTKTAIMRVGPNQLVELLLPMLDPKAELITKPYCQRSCLPDPVVPRAVLYSLRMMRLNGHKG